MAVEKSPFALLYLEVCNDTDSAINFSACDLAGLCVIPKTAIQPGGILTYNSTAGSPAAGLSWVASQVGLVAWYTGQGT